MGNKNYRLEKKLKLFLFLPIVFLFFCLFSCAVKSVPEMTHHENKGKAVPTNSEVHSEPDKVTGSLSKNTIMGYSSGSQTLFTVDYAPAYKNVFDYPVRSTASSVKGNESGKKYVMGYPCRPKILLAPTPEEVILLIKD